MMDATCRKLLIQSADFLFTANPKTIKWALGKKHANEDEFKKEFKSLKPCLHGSDAKEFSKLFEPDMQRYCWIKADPTFDGLKQIINEPEERVFIGDQPEILKRVRKSKTKYISTVSFKKVPSSQLNEIWFEKCDLTPFNPGLVAIIGNKGSGKSALSDTIGLLGNSNNKKTSPFLRKEKFCHPKDTKAEHFTACLKWEDGFPQEAPLSTIIKTDTEAEMVAYIPQNYLERICSDEVEGKEVNEELRKLVIFSHVEKTDQIRMFIT